MSNAGYVQRYRVDQRDSPYGGSGGRIDSCFELRRN